MKRLSATLYIVLAVCFSAYAQNWKEAMEQYNYKQAISILDTEADSLRNSIGLQQDSAAAAQECQKLKEILLKKATCQKNLYKFNDAIETLDQALQVGGEDAATFAGIAECHILMGNNMAAYMFYNNAIMLAPDNLFLRIQKMMLEYKMEEYGSCIAEGKNILMNDTIPSILITVGNSFNKMNLMDSALVYYRKAYEMNRYDYRTLEKISNIFLGREMYDTVLHMANNYLETDSTNYVISPIKGIAQYSLKDYTGAYNTFMKSLEYGCDRLSGYWYLGMCKLKEKDYDTARTWFNKASELDSTNVELIYYQGVCYANSPWKYMQEAEECFAKAESLMQPDSTMMYKIHSSRAEMFMNTDNYKEAVKHFGLANGYNTLIPSQLMQMGFSYRLLKDYPNALKCYEEYFKVGKKDSRIWKFVEAEVEFIKEEQFMQAK